MVEQIRCVEGVARLVVVNNVEIGARTGAINQRGKSWPASLVIFPYLSFIPRGGDETGYSRLRDANVYFRKHGEKSIFEYFSIFRGG